MTCVSCMTYLKKKSAFSLKVRKPCINYILDQRIKMQLLVLIYGENK